MDLVESTASHASLERPRGERLRVLALRIPACQQLLVGLVAITSPACDTRSGAAPGRSLPDARVARRALEDSLSAWRDSPSLQRTVSALKPVMFVDQQRQPGQELRQFSVLGETETSESYRRYLVRLELDRPQETVRAFYYVFGQGPTWVYRAEDFDMIMHMDQSMMAAPPPAAGTPGNQAGAEASPKAARRNSPDEKGGAEASPGASPR
jgi:hypothetical protein